MSIKSDNTLLPVLFGEFSDEIAQFVYELDIVDTVEKDETLIAESSSSLSEDVPMDNLGSTEDLIHTDRWNLDIVDDEKCMDGTFEPGSYGDGVDVYIVGTGINFDHKDFGDRSGKSGTRAKFGGSDIIDALTGSNQQGRDCNGLGTHCAGVAAGLYSGIAKDANLFSIRAVDCRGMSTSENFIHGLLAVLTNHNKEKFRSGFIGSIASLSMAFPKSSLLNRYVELCVQHGIIVVTATGNTNKPSCYFSPGSSVSINVGTHTYDESTCAKPMGKYSNFGRCNDIMAPGVAIKSASFKSDSDFVIASGTAVAASHVAGVAALIKSINRDITHNQIKLAIKANGIDDIDRSAKSSFIQQYSHAKRLYVKAK